MITALLFMIAGIHLKANEFIRKQKIFYNLANALCSSKDFWQVKNLKHHKFIGLCLLDTVYWFAFIGLCLLVCVY